MGQAGCYSGWEDRHVNTRSALLVSFLIAFAFSSGGALAQGQNPSFLGPYVYIPSGTYGNWVTIGTSDPYVDDESSFEVMDTYNTDSNGNEHFIRTGWAKGAACGINNNTTTQVFYSWGVVGGSELGDTCTGIKPSGDHDYATQYNPSNGYWCIDFDGVCIESTYYTGPQLTTAYYVALFGETGDTNAWMGNKGQTNAVYISNARYFNLSGTAQWITYSSGQYAFQGRQCAPGCPYGYQTGFAATVLYTDNWTN